MQGGEMAKAVSKVNPSYESFRPNQIHKPQYQNMDDRPSTHAMSLIRRYPNGELDLIWAANHIIDALRLMEDHPEAVTPLQDALLTVVFPMKFRKMEPRQAEVRTKLSKSEKESLAEYVKAHLAEVTNYNAGRGGGSVPGRTRSTQGG